ncbi:T7SS effector LXG polymorphic toxin [Streptococcus oralis]|nr:T7SS effector LXG polymorphic toxin [Streptococcus oralis]
MSYNIKFDDITSVQVESQKTINAWGESVASLNKAMTDFINNQNLQGQAISSMRRYLVEVHGTLLQTLVNLMNDYSTNLLLYKDGYYQIDSHLHTKLPGQEFTRLHSDLKGSRDKLKNEIEVLNTTKDKISDLVSYDGSSHTKTVMDYNFLLNQIKNLDSSITQYESNHASQDLVAFKELLAATKSLIAEHASKTRTVGTYQSGDFAKLKSVQRFAIAYKQATQQMESRVERVKAAQERDKVRFEALAAEDRAKNGWKDLAIGVVTVAFGILAIIGTLGTATPLVVAGGIVGFGTTAYGLSNMYEAGQDIKLGNAGDIQTKAGNPIRDTLFMGNDKLYHDVGNVFVTASAIMIPIGQTQSVVKGLTQFAIGEAGAYTAGQVAYHGTKLLGGSEEDAQTANFIGNIVGGYTASSAASKFSLNKVKTQFSPEWNEYLNEFPKIEIDKNKVDEILRISPNPDDGVFRPNPRRYLPKEYRQAHKELFDDGVAAFVKDDFFIQKFGNFGREDGAFVFPKDVAKAMIKEADGNPRKLEALLGLDEGSLGDSPKMVLPQEVHNYRIPDGNEGGSRANPQWRPGGKTYPGGVPEAVIDPVPKDKLTLVDIW